MENQMLCLYVVLLPSNLKKCLHPFGECRHSHYRFIITFQRLFQSSQSFFAMVCLLLNRDTEPLIVTRPITGTGPLFSLPPFM